MAGRPSKEKEAVVENTQPTQNLEVKLAEKDKEISDMKTLMLQMQAQMQSLMMNQQSQVSQKNDEFVSIYKSISVVNLFDGQLNLGTLPNGGGKNYSFTRFGESRNIVYNDLRDIIGANFNFAKEGMFYILDTQVVEEMGLKDYYEKLLTKEQIESIIEEDKNTIVEIFKSVPEVQKDTVVDIITRQMANDVDFDLNKISAISDAYGKDLKTMAKDLKFAIGDRLEK